MTPRVINLGERRKALDPVVVTDGNSHRFNISPFLPASVLADILTMSGAEKDPAGAAEAMRESWRAVFGAEHAAEAMRAFSADEFNEILKEVYDITPGESLASLTS